ncbi:MAG: hypothetical protein KG003_02255 [Bacteroidetes bacterium]|nr:hypothetical protein [Bacteroidota bacterium]
MNKLFTAIFFNFFSILLFADSGVLTFSEVNPVIGDRSFIARFGEKPTSKTDNLLRISTHLEYVESLLKQKDVSYLPESLQKSRAHLIELLHQYRLNMVFPENTAFPGVRVPCFIDNKGKICAVGYLIEKTAGRDIAEKINQIHQYH